MIEIVKDDSPKAFLDEVGPIFYQHEALNGLILGITEGLIKYPPKIPAVLVRILENGKLISAASQTPPMNLVITQTPILALEKLAQYLYEEKISFPGVVGPAEESEAFAKMWSALSGVKCRLGMNQRLYKLDKVIMPNIPGEFRLAHDSEAGLVSEWLKAFAAESLPLGDQRDDQHWNEFGEKAVKSQSAHFWIHDNKPVSMAFISRPTKNGVTINAVYTPKDSRKKGYASGVVAHLSQKMLDSGKKFCVLYTDLANPTSNKIYQNIGYREESDSKHFIFE